ncbi:MAG: hypothetical protein E7262_09515 [Lachnospiraceae bacterium]|nr:hypothetical protein [Lachnospiraceae bacterium]
MLRTITYDIIALAIVLVYIFSFIFILKDSKGKGMIHIVIWCIVNFFFPIVGYFVYCMYTKYSQQKEC